MTTISPVTLPLVPTASRPRQQQAVRFGGIFGKEALTGLAVDTLGILVPKLVVARGSLNRKEEWMLEGLEDIAFYFAVPALGHYVFSRLFQKLLQKTGASVASHTLLGKALSPTVARNPWILGAKAGTVLATTALAAGLEYMVPHIKNVITATAYNTKNFTAVANLEASRSQLKAGESDPVDKARRRVLPVALIAGAVTALGFGLPVLAARLAPIRPLLQFFNKHIDFGKGSPFDMSKPILAILALVGLGGYLDAARDNLERKELTTRVAIFTIPYYLFGKELAGNFLAKIFQNSSVAIGARQVKIKDLVPFINPNLPRTSFLDFNRVVSDTHVINVLDRLKVPAAAKAAILGKHNFINYAKFALSALVVGILANLVAFHQTKVRHQAEQEAQQAVLQKTQPVRMTPTVSARRPVNAPVGTPFTLNHTRVAGAPLPYGWSACQAVRPVYPAPAWNPARPWA